MQGMIGVIQPNDLKQLEKFGDTFKKVDVEFLKNKSLKKKAKRKKIHILVHFRVLKESFG